MAAKPPSRLGTGWQPPGGDWTRAKCDCCTRLMRPSNTRLAQWPDTVQHVGRGRCYRCHRQVARTAAEDQARTEAMRRDVADWLRSRGRVDLELAA